MSRDAQYQRFDETSIEEALEHLASSDPRVVTEAILGASLTATDPRWVESAALALTHASDPAVRRAGLLALGHLAIRFRRLEGPAAARQAIARLAQEPQLAGTAEDVGEDLDIGLR